MGTSTCHVMSHDRLVEVPGMCGVVDGGIVAGLYGYEAGQSGVGDIFAWYVDEPGARRATPRPPRPPGCRSTSTSPSSPTHEPVGAHGLVALDWHSGNRSVLVDHELSGVVVGQTLATRPEQGYRALLEATAFGTRVIVETFAAAGVPVTEFIVAGGLLSNPHAHADLRRRAAAADLDHRQRAGSGARLGDPRRGGGRRLPGRPGGRGRDGRGRPGRRTRPNEADAAVYDRLFAEYVQLHDWFGRGGNEVDEAAARAPAPRQAVGQ